MDTGTILKCYHLGYGIRNMLTAAFLFSYGVAIEYLTTFYIGCGLRLICDILTDSVKDLGGSLFQMF